MFSELMLDLHVEEIKLKLKSNMIILTISYKKPRECVLGILSQTDRLCV